MDALKQLLYKHNRTFHYTYFPNLLFLQPNFSDGWTHDISSSWLHTFGSPPETLKISKQKKQDCVSRTIRKSNAVCQNRRGSTQLFLSDFYSYSLKKKKLKLRKPPMHVQNPTLARNTVLHHNTPSREQYCDAVLRAADCAVLRGGISFEFHSVTFSFIHFTQILHTWRVPLFKEPYLETTRRIR